MTGNSARRENPRGVAGTIGDPVSELDRRWDRVGRNAAYMAGASFLIGTVLFLLDAADLLGKGPEYHATAAGQLQDEANFWAAYFNHQHRILWTSWAAI